ncbi:type II secretion system protein [bacterium]|nr:type II secretion system protein [bacterium]
MTDIFNKKTNFYCKPFRKYLAFTLAEVLITLGIIGIVAAMTIPTLSQKTQERETVSKLKKVFSTLTNAYNLAVNEDGTPDTWNLDANLSATGATNILNELAPHLNITKNCGTTEVGCFPEGTGDAQSNSASKVILSDGTMVSFVVWSPTCNQDYGSGALANMCAFFETDINGFKKPNAVGKDRFRFYITKEAIVPYGTATSTEMSFANNCAKSHGGLSCTAWVIYNENMDYLHCTDLSWSGKTKCD